MRTELTSLWSELHEGHWWAGQVSFSALMAEKVLSISKNKLEKRN